MPTFRVRSNNTGTVTITASDEAQARRRAMQKFHGAPQPFGYVARKFGETGRDVRPAVSPREWTGAGLMVDVVDEKGQ